MCSNCQWDQDYEAIECPECKGDRIITTEPAGTGYSDEPEYEPCPTCHGTGSVYEEDLRFDERFRKS